MCIDTPIINVLIVDKQVSAPVNRQEISIWYDRMGKSLFDCEYLLAKVRTRKDRFSRIFYLEDIMLE